jgi:hypothetical protein
MSAWAERALRFNTAPAGYAHGSWWPAALAQIVQARGTAPDAQALARASALITAQHGLAGQVVLDFTDPARRLWLAPAALLRALAIELGVAALRDSLRRCVTRSARQALEQALGAAAIPFALTPRAAAWSAMAGAADAAAVPADLDACAALGAGRMLGCIDDDQPALKARARLMFPREAVLPTQRAAEPERLAAELARRLVEVEPSCRSLLS